MTQPTGVPAIPDFRTTASCEGLARFLRAAIDRSGAKPMRIRLLTSKNEPVVLSWDSPATVVDVTDDAPSDVAKSYGKLDLRTGTFRPNDTPQFGDVLSLLRAVSEQPQAVARAYGRATGQCCFCHRRLTDPRSVRAGYGPTCADRYGLPWG